MPHLSSRCVCVSVCVRVSRIFFSLPLCARCLHTLAVTLRVCVALVVRHRVCHGVVPSSLTPTTTPARRSRTLQRLDDHLTVATFFSSSLVAVHAWRCAACAVWLAVLLTVAFTVWTTSPASVVWWALSWVADVAPAAATSWATVVATTVTFVATQFLAVFARYHVLHVHRPVYAGGVQLVRAGVQPSRVLLHVLLVATGAGTALLLLRASTSSELLSQPCPAASYGHSFAGPEPGEEALWFLPKVVVPEGAPRHCLNGEAILAVLAGASAGLLSAMRTLKPEEALLRVPSLAGSRVARLAERVPDALRVALQMACACWLLLTVVMVAVGGPVIAAFDFLITRLDGHDAHVDYTASTTLPAMLGLCVSSAVQVVRVAALVALANQLARHVLSVILTEPLPMPVLAEGVPLVPRPPTLNPRIQSYTSSGRWRVNTHLLRMCGLELSPPTPLAAFFMSWHTHDRVVAAGAYGATHTQTGGGAAAAAAAAAAPTHSIVQHVGSAALAFLVATAAVGLGLGVAAGLLAGVSLASSMLLMDGSHSLALYTHRAPSVAQTRLVLLLRLGVGVACALSVSAALSLPMVFTAVLCLLSPLGVLSGFARGQSTRLGLGLAFGAAFGVVLSVPLVLMTSVALGAQLGMGAGFLLGVVMVLPDAQLSPSAVLHAASHQHLPPPPSCNADTYGVDGGAAPAAARDGARHSRPRPRPHPRPRSRSPGAFGARRRQQYSDADGNAFGDGYGYVASPGVDMSTSMYPTAQPGRHSVEALMDRPPTRAEAQQLNVLAAAAKPSEIAGAKDTFVNSTNWDEAELLHKWRARMRLAEVEAYACRAETHGTEPRLFDALARSLAFASAAAMARGDAEERHDVLSDSSGRRWMDLMWTCTATIDALSVATQVAAVADVAPRAAHHKPAFARRGSRTVLCGAVLNEWWPYDPVVEQARWLTGGAAGAVSSDPSALLHLMDAADGTGTGTGTGTAAGATVAGRTTSGLDYPYPSQRSSAYAYGDRFVEDDGVPTPLRRRPRAAPGSNLSSVFRQTRGGGAGGAGGAGFGGAQHVAAARADPDQYMAYRARHWRYSDGDASEYGLLQHIIVRFRRSSAQKTQALFQDLHVRWCCCGVFFWVC